MSIGPRVPQWVGCRSCVGLTTWVLVTPVGILAAPLAASPAITGIEQVPRWLLIGLVAQLPMALVLAFGSRIAGHVAMPRACVLVTCLAAGGARGLAIVLLGQTPDASVRIVASAITMAVWLQVIGAARDSRRRYREEVSALLGSLVERELHGRLLDGFSTDAARIVTGSRVSETSSALRDIVQDATDDHARTAALLQTAIEERLRPLSHDLWFSPRPIAPSPHRRLAFVRRALRAQVPVLPLLIAAFGLLAWGSYVLHGVWQGAIVGCAIALTYGAVLVIAQRVVNRPGLAAFIRYVGVGVLPAVVAGTTIGILGLGWPLSPIAVALGLPIITFGVAAARTIGADRVEVIADLHARLAEPVWDRHLGDLVRREIDARTATALHNAVQPALTAAALQLHLAAAMNDPNRARAALDRVSQALDDLTLPARAQNSGRARITEVAAAWSGIAEVDVQLPEVDVTASEWSLLADVIDESIANAVRHGHARSIWIRIDADDATLRVQVRDDGQGDHHPRAPGLGTTWLSTLTDSRSIVTDHDGRPVRQIVVRRPEAFSGRG